MIKRQVQNKIPALFSFTIAHTEQIYIDPGRREVEVGGEARVTKQSLWIRIFLSWELWRLKMCVGNFALR